MLARLSAPQGVLSLLLCSCCLMGNRQASALSEIFALPQARAHQSCETLSHPESKKILHRLNCLKRKLLLLLFIIIMIIIWFYCTLCSGIKPSKRQKHSSFGSSCILHRGEKQGGEPKQGRKFLLKSSHSTAVNSVGTESLRPNSGSAMPTLN